MISNFFNLQWATFKVTSSGLFVNFNSVIEVNGARRDVNFGLCVTSNAVSS